MLTGEFRPNMDAKGRIFMPVRLREQLGDSFVVSRGLDNCVFVFHLDEWEKLAEKIAALPLSKARDIQRFLLSGAEEVQPDAQGRILVPQALRTYAGITREVVVAGVGSRAEIWNAEAWDARFGALSSESVAESMEELGF